MCFITCNFIGRAKYEMGSLGFKPKCIEEFTPQNLDIIVCNNLLKLKDTTDSIYVFYHYNWIKKHFKKIGKAMLCEKWETSEIEYSKCDIKRNKYVYDNVIVVTNIFSRKIYSIYFDEPNIILEKVKKEKNCDNLFDIIKDDDGIYVFSKEYIKSLKKKKFADKEKAIAVIDNVCVDYNNAKYVAYIIFDEKNLKDLSCATFAVNDIKKAVNNSQMIKSLTAMNSIILLNSLQRMRTNNINRINNFRRF